MKSKESETRLYETIRQSLRDVGWNTKSPPHGGDVYAENESLTHNSKLKEALGQRRPDMMVDLARGRYWVIEAKAKEKAMSAALAQAKARAAEINDVEGISCPIVTGVAGSAETTYYVQTECLTKQGWRRLLINKRGATGFISREQVETILRTGDATLSEYEIKDRLFSAKIAEINKILHGGAFHKRKRADILACLLLALANDPEMPVSKTPRTLITDINSRAEAALSSHGKGNFFGEIRINRPTSPDNHVKNRKALTQAIEILRGLNIVSAINSGRDVLGECYEEFLKYANDAKEMGIVLTPRRITNFGADVIDVQRNDIVFDPTCGTGGFLVSALDKVRRDGGDIDKFKKGNLCGIEQDANIATLAIVNMVFRGDGSSNIKEGNCLTAQNDIQANKVLMNPPFAIEQEEEWRFVDLAFDKMKTGALLFAVLPVTTMSSGDDRRGEVTWRENMLERHKLLAVIKMPEDLFYPNVLKGTYGVVIRAHRPHDFGKDKVVWGILRTGIVHSKTKKETTDGDGGNINFVAQSIKNHIASGTSPRYVPAEMDYALIRRPSSGSLDLSPERHIGDRRKRGVFDILSVVQDIKAGNAAINNAPGGAAIDSDNCKGMPLVSFFQSVERGKSGKEKFLRKGDFPLISTSERRNGISVFVHKGDCGRIYPAGGITISANGGSCRAFYHDYEFAANSDVYVCFLKKEFGTRSFALLLCAAINAEKWRYNYYRKFSSLQLEKLRVKIPVTKNGDVDFAAIKDAVRKSDNAKGD